MLKSPIPSFFLFVLVVLLLLAGGRTSAQTPAWAWATSPELIDITGTVTDSAGNSFVTGNFSGTVTLGSTTLVSDGLFSDVFVAKLTPGGAYQWAVRAGGDREELSAALALDRAGNVYVAGKFGSATLQFGATRLTNHSVSSSQNEKDAFVARLSSSGVWQWATSVSGSRLEEATDLAIDGAGRVVVSGRFTSDTTTFGGVTVINGPGVAYTSAFVAQLDPAQPANPWQWVRTPVGGSNSGAIPTALAVDAGGNVSVVGMYTGAGVTLGATVLPTPTPVSGGPGAQNLDMFVAHLDATGAWQWATRVGGSITDEVITGVGLDAAGYVLVGGYFSGQSVFGPTTLTSAGSYDVFVAKLSPTGTWEWVTQGGGQHLETCNTLRVGPGGEVYVGGIISGLVTLGTTSLPAFGTLDAYVARLSATGAWEWATALGDSGDEGIREVAVVNSNQLVVMGFFNGSTLQFGSTTLTANPGYSRGFVAQLAIVTGLYAPPTPALTLAPNPAHRTVRLTGATAPTAILLDALGRTIRTWPLDPATSDLDLAGLPAGLYTVRAGTATRRLVVE